MKRALLALLLAVSAPLAQAAPATDAQVDRLLEVMRARQTLDTMLPQIEASQRQVMAQMTAGQVLTDQQRALLDRIAVRNAQTLREALTWEKLAPMYRDIYRQTFDAQDMESMIDFYGSPAGQRVIEKMPQAAQHTMAAMQALIVPMVQKMQQDVAAELEAAKVEAAKVEADKAKAAKAGEAKAK